MKKLCLLLCLLSVTACSSPNENIYPENPALRTVPVFIISHGWHTGIAVENEYFSDWASLHDEMPRGDYLMFEWGDAKYFPHHDPGTASLLKAAFLPTESVIQITGLNMQPNRYFKNSTVIQIHITPEGVYALRTFLNDELHKNDEKNLVFIQNGLYPNSAFFGAKRIYMLPRTSNSWTAKALKKTGYPVKPFLTFTSESLIRQAKKDGTVLQER